MISQHDCPSQSSFSEAAKLLFSVSRMCVAAFRSASSVAMSAASCSSLACKDSAVAVSCAGDGVRGGSVRVAQGWGWWVRGHCTSQHVIPRRGWDRGARQLTEQRPNRSTFSPGLCTSHRRRPWARRRLCDHRRLCYCLTTMMETSIDDKVGADKPCDRRNPWGHLNPRGRHNSCCGGTQDRRTQCSRRTAEGCPNIRTLRWVVPRLGLSRTHFKGRPLCNKTPGAGA